MSTAARTKNYAYSGSTPVTTGTTQVGKNFPVRDPVNLVVSVTTSATTIAGASSFAFQDATHQAADGSFNWRTVKSVTPTTVAGVSTWVIRVNSVTDAASLPLGNVGRVVAIMAGTDHATVTEVAVIQPP